MSDDDSNDSDAAEEMADVAREPAAPAFHELEECAPDAAEKMVNLAREARDGRTSAREYIRTHEMIAALEEALDILGESRQIVTVEWDEDATEEDTVVGFKIGPSDTADLKIIYKQSYKTGRLAVRHANDFMLKQAVDLIDADHWQSAAVATVEELAESGIELGEAVPDE